MLPPIAHQAANGGRYVSPVAPAEAQKYAQLQRHARQLSAQNSTLKQVVRRNSSMVDSSEAAAASLREQLTKANEELASVRAELRAVKHERDDEVLSLESQLKELRESNAMLHAKLDMALLAKRKVDLENKRTIESIVTRHEKDASTRAERHKLEVEELKEQLEMVVLKAAIDLNRQYRELYIKNFRANKTAKVPPRRVTDGCVPLMMEMNNQRKNRSTEDAVSPQVAGPPREVAAEVWDLKHDVDVNDRFSERSTREVSEAGSGSSVRVSHGRRAWQPSPDKDPAST